jgi:ElaB/YqjD/DUF883 family membrane-anchored ribosome-binding protein
MVKKAERIKDEMDSLIDRTRDAVVHAAARAEHGIDSAAENVAERAHTAGKAVRTKAKTAARGAHARLQDAATTIDRGVARAHDGLSQAVTTATDQFREHSGMVLLLAAAAGFVLGLLVPRRRLPA